MSRFLRCLAVFLGISGVFQSIVGMTSIERITALSESHASLYGKLMEKLADTEADSELLATLFCEFADQTLSVIRILSKQSDVSLHIRQDIFERTMGFFRQVMGHINNITLDKSRAQRCAIQITQIRLFAETYGKTIVAELARLDREPLSVVVEDAGCLDMNDDTAQDLSRASDLSGSSQASAPSDLRLRKNKQLLITYLVHIVMLRHKKPVIAPVAVPLTARLASYCTTENVTHVGIVALMAGIVAGAWRFL